ncbi:MULTISPECIES: hypothetical protein [unclassified Rhizobium]|uniref:hypothetical protein n=1 Tax=Rhizobium TaxID=379 RepID=UPI00114CDC49|nr:MULTISPECIES: hypothetical protein [unclassified Rhizobium]QYA12327.1 hypothetical protein J5284_17760 [Rhizobium sp. AB2/73]UEQ81742.1 hypothetical protein I8E17_04245 [Rhizobium sp. AB2/73]
MSFQKTSITPSQRYFLPAWRRFAMPVAQYGNFAPHVYIKRDELQNPCGETMTPAAANRIHAKEPAMKPALCSFDSDQNVAS